MSNPDSQTTLLIKFARSCIGFAMVLMALVACTTGDRDVPTPTVSNHVMSTPTATARAPQVLPPLTSADLSTDAREVTVEDGYIPDGEMVTPFDTNHPAIGNLETNLLQSVQRAAADAALDGIDLLITSGWRSERYQQHLLDEGIVTYGSEEEARKWVNTPEQSTHVSGNAVDIGPMEAYSWLSQHGNEYGLCQIYANELWHYELATSPGGECPPQISDASAGR